MKLKEFIRISKMVIGVILTLLSFMVLLMALCTVAITRWAWGGVFALAGAVLWLTYVAAIFERINTKKEKENNDKYQN